MTYNRYHSNIILAIQTETLPSELEKQIPSSTFHRFKTADLSSYLGHNLAESFENDMDTLKSFAKDNKAIKTYKLYLFISQLIIKWFVKIPRHLSFSLKKKIVHLFDRFKNHLDLKKLLKIIRITSYKFRTWKDQITYFCTGSALSLCLKKNPNQLTKPEIEKIKDLCQDSDFTGWPISSLAKYALRQKLLSVSLGTWYKYVNLLNLSRFKPKNRRKKNKTGIRASEPHQIYHIDVTVFKTMDNIKAYIYFIVDNFSRFILSWRVSLTLSATTCLENIKEAYHQYLKDHPQNTEIILLCDGGPENNNHTVEEFTDNENIPLKKIVANEISISNSLVEAVNKTIKYSFLYHAEIPDFSSLTKHLKKAVYDYNYRKPHYAHKGLTPAEVLEGQKLDSEALKIQVQNAIKARILYNQQENCGKC